MGRPGLASAPRALLFDLGGTLLREERFDIAAGTARVMETARNPRGVSVDDVVATARTLDAARSEAREAAMIEFPAAGFQRLLYERFGIEIDADPLVVERLFWRAAVTLVAERGVGEALAGAGARGLPLAVLSNVVSSSAVIRDELERHDLLDHFVFVASSADYGFRKPHPELFVTMAGKLELPPAAIWYLGNEPVHDVAGARGAGLGAVFYNPRGLPAPDPPPDHELRAWSELAPLLDEALG